MRPLKKVKIRWSGRFAYAIGLITSDGNLSKDGRHIDFTSKDEDLVQVFKDCLKIDTKISRKARGSEKEKKYFKVAFGDVHFYAFLLSIGLCPNKSKILKELKIPQKYFGDFLRGCIDGDGNICLFNHPEAHIVQVKLRLASASMSFLQWIRSMVTTILKTKGGWIEKGLRVNVLCYGKKDAVTILRQIYSPSKICLMRKYVIVEKILTS